MRVRCPCCGATNSLDALIAHDDARTVLMLLIKLGGELPALTMRYLGLFRPAQTELSFARVAKLLNDLLPDMQAQRIERDGRVYDAPPAAWAWAMQQTLAAREAGRLNTPLKNHGYLYEVLTGYRPADVGVATVTAETTSSAPQPVGIAALEAMKRRG